MRNTNSKETRRAVEAYVMDQVHDVLDRCDVRTSLRPVDDAYKIMRDEVKFQTDFRNGRYIKGAGYVEQYRNAGRMIDFTPATTPYWVWYLAVQAGCFEAYYDAARGLVSEWLDETPDEAAQYNNEKVWELYAHLTAKAFERLREKDITPRKVDTSYFIEQYEDRNGGHFFDRETLRFFGQTRKSFSVTAYHTIKDYEGIEHDCYRVLSTGKIDGYRFSHVHYFDRVTFKEVFTADNNEEA